MAVHCLENKRAPVQLAQLESEILLLLGDGPLFHPEILFRRIAPEAFQMPREALWCLVYFHQGRNKDTGLYYSKRALQTPTGKAYRIGESVRFLEKKGLLVKRSSYGWHVPQSQEREGQKYPPLRASFLAPFFQNPTKERWIALRFIHFLATQLKAPRAYRPIQDGLGCSTEIARFLASMIRRSNPSLFQPARCRNRTFNWLPEREKKTSARTLENAPITVQAIGRNLTKNSHSRTEKGGQYNSPRKEIQKKNPSTTPPAAEKGEGFFEGLNEEMGKKNPTSRKDTKANEGATSITPLSDLGFTSQEALISASGTAHALDSYQAELANSKDKKAVRALFEMAQRKAAFKKIEPEILAQYCVDVWLELKRRKDKIKASAIGYFFTALRNNLATGYCRLDQKREAWAAAAKRESLEREKDAVRRMNDLQAETRRKVKAQCLLLEPGFFEIPFQEYQRSNAIFRASFEALRARGEFDPLAVELFEYCERVGGNEENLLRFVRANPSAVGLEIQDMRHPRKAA